MKYIIIVTQHPFSHTKLHTPNCYYSKTPFKMFTTECHAKDTHIRVCLTALARHKRAETLVLFLFLFFVFG